MSSIIGRRPGNSTRQTKRINILRCAGEIFAELGYDRASMETIAHKTGVTKVTVYAHFHDKAGLYAAAMDYWLGQLPQPEFESCHTAPLREQLSQVAHELLRQTAHPAAQAISQILARSTLTPSLEQSERWQQRHHPCQNHIEQILIRCCQCDNPALAAQQFLMLVIGTLDPPHIFPQATSTGDAIERALAAVDVFIRAYPPQCHVHETDEQMNHRHTKLQTA
jgi:TetR/AcrR family transcriptional repressor of mexJK operon